jgi:hypothetical protein
MMEGTRPVIKYVYEIDYPFGEKRKYLEWGPVDCRYFAGSR